uniref:Letm1 RBD domain-containing protein n=1 Tax=Romanomermis culicivorax TaxID=13658 RepID=A0A915KLC8_ROMCU
MSNKLLGREHKTLSPFSEGGGRACLGDLKEYYRIRQAISRGKPLNNLSVHELHILLLTPNDLQKMFLLGTIIVLPFTVFIVGAALQVAYSVFFPRFLLTRHFWTPDQIAHFNDVTLQSRKRHYFDKAILQFFEKLENKSENVDFARDFKKYGRISLEQQHSYESILNSSRLSLDKLRFVHMFFLGRSHGIIPLLNGELMLKNRAALIKCLDAKLVNTNLYNLNAEELDISLFVRQINARNFGKEAKVHALDRWLKFSTRGPSKSDSWILHAILFDNHD